MSEGNIRVIEVNRSVFDDNDQEANSLRRILKKDKTFLVNVMSSPGAGKTTTLIRLINSLKSEYKIAVMEADIDSDVDAVKVAKETGVTSLQVHTSGMCHLDAGMTKKALDEVKYQDFDIIFLENVGNLVCPAEFDTGANLDMVILSVPEGDDKPLKYPLVFQKAGLVVINKMDALPYFTFSLDTCKENIRMRNEKTSIVPISAKTGEGMEILKFELIRIIQEWRNE